MSALEQQIVRTQTWVSVRRIEKKSSGGSDGVKPSKRKPALCSELELRQADRFESLTKGHRIPLATRQRFRASDLTCRDGMVFGEPRNVEKFARMPPVAIRSDSKDMAGFEWTRFLRGKSDRGVDMSCLQCVWEHSLVGRKGSGSVVEGPNV